MRTVIISDIHGKVAPLRRVLEAHAGDRVICLGDVLGSGDNRATLSLLRERQIPCVKGNHEVDLLPHYKLSPDDAAYVDSWPHVLTLEDVLLVHTWLEQPKFRYRMIDSTLSAKEMFSSRPFHRAFVGHSHSPGWWTLEEERPVWNHANVGSILELGKQRRIVDVGSVGEPHRAEDPRYVVWEGQRVSWRSLP